ncbi:MAG: thioredoxin domain-containing protein [Spirochaetes bacterium]|nr:thioredoxin domain-containing protein [Spirochaetota bacterium]
MKSQRWCAVLLLLCALIGTGATFLIAYERHFREIIWELKYQENFVLSMASALCGKRDSYVSCERVDKSTYSHFLSIPQTSWGMMYFTLLLCGIIPLFVFRNSLYNDYIRVLFWMLLIGTAYSLYMFAVSIIFIRALCPLCVVTYCANLTSLGLVVSYLCRWKLNPFSLREAVREFGEKISLQSLRALVAFSALSIGAAILVGLFLDYCVIKLKENVIEERRNAIIDKIIDEFLAEKVHDVQPSFVCSFGKAGAPILIVEFSDFLCGHCKKASEIITKIAQEFGDSVHVVFMNFPLDSTCNRGVNKNVHPGACLLAKGAICASKQNEFPVYLEHAFNLAPKNTDVMHMRQLAVLSALDVPLFESCLVAHETEIELQKQIAEAQRLNVHATPTIFINGRHLKKWGSVEIVRKAIRKVLENK